jgi:hypothetical protein
MLWVPATHQEYTGLDGELNGDRHRRISSVPVSEKTRSSATILSAAARFFLQDEQVKDGGHDGIHGEAWGGLHRRRRLESEHARVSNWGGIGRTKGKWRTSVRFIGPPECAGGQQRRRRPRDVAHLVAVASSCASSRGDEDDDASPSLSTRRGTWATLGCAGLVRLGRLVGCAGGLLQPGKLGRLSFLFYFPFSVFYFLFYILLI